MMVMKDTLLFCFPAFAWNTLCTIPICVFFLNHLRGTLFILVSRSGKGCVLPVENCQSHFSFKSLEYRDTEELKYTNARLLYFANLY